MHPFGELVDVSLYYLSSLVRFGLRFITEFLKSYWSSSTTPACKVDWIKYVKACHLVSIIDCYTKTWCCIFVCWILWYYSFFNFYFLFFMERHFILNIAVCTCQYDIIVFILGSPFRGRWGGWREEYGLWQICLIILSFTIVYKCLLGSHIGQEMSIWMNKTQSLSSICRWSRGDRALHSWTPRVPATLQSMRTLLPRARCHSHLGVGRPTVN